MGWLGSHLKVWMPLASGLGWRISGPWRPDAALFADLRAVPPDPMPEFSGRQGMARRGRGRDHPRYGRFIHAFGRWLRPAEIVEIGTYAGGTTVGWARALMENGSGRITCVDNDSYARGIFPELVAANLKRMGFPENRLRFVCGDSRVRLPELASELGGKVDVCLVDADHTYEGALADLRHAVPLIRPGGFILVHDVDPHRPMAEATPDHPSPVLEAFHEIVRAEGITEWCILEFIRKHLGVIRVPQRAVSHSADKTR